MQIDKVLHLKQLPQNIISPQKIMQQHYSPGDIFFFKTHMLPWSLVVMQKLLHAMLEQIYQFSLPLLEFQKCAI